MLLEVGYIGRYADKLPQSTSFGQVPYMFKDPASGQTFAQAFDAVARQLRADPNATVTPQPWFENLVPVVNGVPGTAGNMTQALAAALGSNFINGNINQIFLNIDRRRIVAGLQPFNNYLAQTLFLRSSVGRSNFNAPFDVTHIFNGTFRYELPFGKGRFFGASNAALDKIIGGWYLSGIYTARSGDALTVVQGAGVWGGSLFLGFNSGAIPTVDPKSFGNGVNSGVNGSNNIGTNGAPANGGTGLNLS